MTMVLTDRTTSYDGSPSGVNNVYTATGPIVITFSKSGTGYANCQVWSRSDTAGYVETMNTDKTGRYRIELVSGDQFYISANITSTAGNVNVSYVDA